MLQAIGPIQARVESVVLGVQLAHVVVRLSENHLVGTFIPRADAVALNLRIGNSIKTQITESEVLFQKE